MEKLGALKKVNLRDIWKREDTDFTVWLAREENISILMDEIGVQAENIKTEDSAGQFSCDITADEVQSNKKIVIENQLEKTDHSHLGQLLTYASSFDASIIIWVVSEVRDEHKQAIEWFNRNMIEEISFFLVEVELWKIGDSDPAPKFNIVSEPNDWAKIAYNKSSSDKEMTERRLLNLSFWEGLKDYSAANNNDLRISMKPRAQHWYTIRIGTSNTHIAFIMSKRHSHIAAEIYTTNQPLYDQLESRKKEFNEILRGYDVEWMPLPGKKASRIIVKHSCQIDDKHNWNEYYKWLINSGELLQKAYNSLIIS